MSVTDSIFDLSATYSEDQSIESMNFLKVFEENGLVNNNRRLLKFRIDDLTSFLLLSRSYVVLQLELQSGTAIPYGANTVGPAFINGLDKAFKRGSMSFNGQVVDNYHNYMREHINVMDKLEVDRDYDASVSLARGYVPEIDTPIGGATDSGINLKELSAVDNKSLAYRSASLTGGAVKQNVFAVPLHRLFRFCKFYDKVLRSVQIEVELELASDEEFLCHATAGYGKDPTEIPKWDWHNQGAFLMVPRIVPSISVRSSLNSMLSSGFKNNLQYTDFHTYRVLAGTERQDVRISTTISRPVKIYIGFQKQTKSGAMNENTLLYDRANIDKISVLVNGSQNPVNEYEVNMGAVGKVDTRGDRHRAYYDLIHSRGLSVSSMSDKLNFGTMGFNEWERNPIYVFNLNNVTDTQFQGSSEIAVTYERAAAGANASYMYVIVEYVKLAQISLSNTDSSVIVQ